MVDDLAIENALRDSQNARLREVAKKILSKRRSIETDIKTAHQSRGAAASGWMREDDRDFRADLANLFDDLEKALLGNND